MFFKRVKKHKECRERKDKLRDLSREAVRLFGEWRVMLHVVNKVVTIIGETEEEVVRKAAAEMEPLYVSLFSERKDVPSGAAKRLGCLAGKPELKVNKTDDGGNVRTVATITYAQYILEPGFSEEEYRLAVDAYDKAEAEYQKFRKECWALGMDV